MMNRKLLAITINYNGGKRIVNLIRSLAGFSSAGKVIVVDNGSVDESVGMIKEIKGVRVIENGRNLGFAAAVNAGVKEAYKDGVEWVLLVNQDIEITDKDIIKLSGCLSSVVSPILKFRRLDEWVFDLGGKVNWVLGRTTHREIGGLGDVRGVGNEVDYVSGACMLIKRGVFDKIGFFDERFFLYFEDADFCLRAKKAGFIVVVDKNVVVKHNISEHWTTHDVFKIRQNLKSNLRFILKWVPWYFKPLAYVYWLVLAAKLTILK